MLTFGNRRPARVTNIVIPSKNSSQRWRKNNFRFLVSYRDTTSLNSNRSHSTATGTIVGGGDSPISAPLRQTRQQIEARKVSTFRHRPLGPTMFFDREERSIATIRGGTTLETNTRGMRVLRGVCTACNVEIFIGRLRVTNTVWKHGRSRSTILDFQARVRNLGRDNRGHVLSELRGVLCRVETKRS